MKLLFCPPFGKTYDALAAFGYNTLDSNTPLDGKTTTFAKPLPVALAARVGEASSLLDAHILRSLWRESNGRQLRAGAQVERITAECGFGPGDVDRLVPIYNAALAERPAGRSVHRNSGRRLAGQLDDLTGVLPTAIAERFPTRVDHRISGAIHHRDVYGDVFCSATLRPEHVGLLAHVCGIFTNRETYEPLGYLTGSERVMTSERKLYFSVFGTHEPGGSGIAALRRLLVSLAGAEMIANQSDLAKNDPYVNTRHGRVRAVDRDENGELCFAGHYETTRLAGSRDRSIPSNPIASIKRLVVGETGAEWAEVDDPRPTDTSAEFTIAFDLAPWLIKRIVHDGDRVFVAMKTWRALAAPQARLLAFLQSKRAKQISYNGRSYNGFTCFFSAPLCLQLGYTASNRYSEIRDTYFAALCQIQRATSRYEWVSPPYRRFRNMLAYSFTVRVAAGGSSKLRLQAFDGRLSKRWIREAQNRIRLLSYVEVVGRGNSPPPLRI